MVYTYLGIDWSYLWERSRVFWLDLLAWRRSRFISAIRILF